MNGYGSDVRGGARVRWSSPFGSATVGTGSGENEVPHQKRIPCAPSRLATTEVTVEQFQKFRPDHVGSKRYSPGPDTPAVSMSWYQAAGYCNWLEPCAGGDPGRLQWCYEPNKDGEYDEEDAGGSRGI